MLALYEHKTDDAAIDALPPDVLCALGLDIGWLKARLPEVQTFVDVAIRLTPPGCGVGSGGQ